VVFVDRTKLEEYNELVNWLQANRQRLDPTMAAQLEFLENEMEESYTIGDTYEQQQEKDKGNPT
jgi:hypothetical protein